MAQRSKRTFKHAYKTPARYDFEQRAGESDLQYYKRIAKVADQRLVRLETLSQDDPAHFGKSTNFAYARAMTDISMFSKGQRFNVKLPDDPRKVKEAIMSVRYFLEAPTSTKGGITEVYKKRADTLNQKYGTDFTWEDLASYFGKGQHDRDSGRYGSKTSLYAIGLIHQEKKLLQGIKNNTNIEMSGPVKDAAIEMLRGRSLNKLHLSAAEKKAILKKLEGRKGRKRG